MTIIAHYSTWNQFVKNKKKEEVQEESGEEKERGETSEKVIRFHWSQKIYKLKF